MQGYYYFAEGIVTYWRAVNNEIHSTARQNVAILSAALQWR